MVKCDRFAIEYALNNKGDTIQYYPHPVIYDRVNKKIIAVFDTDDDEINEKLAKLCLNALNREYAMKIIKGEENHHKRIA